jgi:subtilisin family serine protease
MRVPPFSVLKAGVIALWLSASVNGQGAPASLSADLGALLASGATAPVRAILRGDVAALTAVAARDQLVVHRVLDGLVVVDATPAQLAALRHVAGVLGISRDAVVAPFMTTSQKAMAADQARAGSSDLLGIGGYPGVTGHGVGVAVIDSGISTGHRALTGKVVASVNFATGDTSTADGYGHGTHIAGIIAGQSTTVTPLYRGGVAQGAHHQREGAVVTGLGLHERRDRRHSVDGRQPRPLRHQGREPVAGPSAGGAMRDRSVVSGGGAGGDGRAGDGGVGRQSRQARRRCRGVRQHHDARGLALGHHRRRAQHLGH